MKPDYDGLAIDPCIPAKWDRYEVSRLYRGARYNITILNPDHVNRGVKSVVINGEAVKGNELPIMPDGSVNTVEVTLG